MADRPNLSPYTHDAWRALDGAAAEHLADWMAHVAAGRIGTRTEMTPAQRAVHAANDALFRERARRERAAARGAAR